MPSDPVDIRIAGSFETIDPQDWNRIANPVGLPRDPFLSWEFLDAMERSGAATPRTGWRGAHILLYDQGNLCAALPMWFKSHSRGEFVFDHSWAEAWERAGGRYYPKLLSAIPFTPVSGRRLLVSPGPQAGLYRQQLISAAIDLAQQAKHICLTKEESISFSRVEGSKTAKFVFLFGVSGKRLGLHFQLHPYQPVHFGTTSFILTDSIADIFEERQAGGKEKSGQLWRTLKACFHV